MQVIPVPEDKASEGLKKEYEFVKEALKSQTLPVFFTYLGAFPSYLTYIREQLTENLINPSFLKVVTELHRTFCAHVQLITPKSDETQDWLMRYSQNPSFYYFQKDLETITAINIKVACVFIGLREAVKGWAVAAKQLKSEVAILKEDEISKVNQEEFVFDTKSYLSELSKDESIESGKKQELAAQSRGIAHKSKNDLSVNLLPEYIKRCQLDYNRHLKREEYWTMRVQFEKNILNTLAVFPHLIYSPYNVIAKLFGDDEKFFELLYLLSQHFPTLAMQRLIFSEFLIVK